MSFGNPAASLGFVGWVKLSTMSKLLRVTSCDVSAKQTIDQEEVVDSRFDRSVYKLNPIEIGGNISLPAIMEATSPVSAIPATSIGDFIWNSAAYRDGNGKLVPFDILVAYTNQPNTVFEYKNCIVDTCEFTMQESQTITLNMGVIGRSRAAGGTKTNSPPGMEKTNEPPARAAVWSDGFVNIEIHAAGGGVTTLITGDAVRQFNCSLSNNSNRYYTLNGKLFPQDIAPTKRDVTGQLTFMGRIQGIADHAFTNQERCSEKSSINFGYNANTAGNPHSDAGCGENFNVTLPNTVFEIEELAITNELFETSMNYRSFPGSGVQAMDADPLVSKTSI